MSQYSIIEKEGMNLSNAYVDRPPVLKEQDRILLAMHNKGEWIKKAPTWNCQGVIASQPRCWRTIANARPRIITVRQAK